MVYNSKEGTYNTHCFFIVFVVIACLLTILALYGCHLSHKNSIDVILECQDRQLQVTDSLMVEFCSHIEGVSRSDFEDLVSTSRWSQIQADTKSMIELEMTTIQNEYETLGIWAGIMTIVFLIFSFYSLFKTDDLVKQGKEGLQELTAIKEKGDSKIKEFERFSSETVSDFRVKSLERLNDVDRKSKERLDRIDKQLEDKSEKFKKMLDEKGQVAKKYVDETKNNIDEAYKLRIKELKTLTDGYQMNWDELSGQMSYMKSQIEVLRTMIVGVTNKNSEA